MSTKQRLDHRIRLRVADIKNLFYGEIPQNLMDHGADILCSLLILEKIDPSEIVSQSSSKQGSLRRGSVLATMLGSDRRASLYQKPSLNGNQKNSQTELVISKRGSIISNMGTSMYAKVKKQSLESGHTQASFETIQDLNSKGSKKESIHSNNSHILKNRKMSIMATGALLGISKIKRGSISLSADSKMVTSTKRNSIYSKSTTASNESGRRGSVLDAVRRPSVLQTLMGSKPPSQNGMEMMEFKITARIDIRYTNGLSNDEYEFELPEGFHSVVIQIIKKGRLSDVVLGTLELPALCFEPDETLHEDWFSLRNVTETFERGHAFRDFDVLHPRPCYHCNELMIRDDFQTNVQFFRCDRCNIVCHENCNTLISATCSKIASVRLRYLYIREPILDSSRYRFVYELFSTVNMDFFRVLARVSEDKEDLAFHITKIGQTLKKRQLVLLISGLCEDEIGNTKEFHTLFRGNSLATKALDMYMKQETMGYLLSCLEAPIREIVKQDKDCEIDPSKLLKADDNLLIEDRVKTLERYTEMIIRAITSNVKACPHPFRCILSKIYKKANQHFSKEPTAGYIAVTSFLFLRFFGASILGPETFGITFETLSPRNRRTLTMLSKIIQKIANLCEFDSIKEPFTVRLNSFVPSYHPIITIFVNEICKVRLDPPPTEEKKLDVLQGLGLGLEPSSQSISIHSKKKASFFMSLLSLCGCTKPQMDDGRSTPFSASLNMFKEMPKEEEGDYVDLDVSMDDISRAVIEVDLHLAAFSRHLQRYGEKMILYCYKDTETEISYVVLHHVNSICADQHQYRQNRKWLLSRTQESYRHKLLVANIDQYESESDLEEENDRKEEEEIEEAKVEPDNLKKSQSRNTSVKIPLSAATTATIKQLAKLIPKGRNSQLKDNSRSSSIGEGRRTSDSEGRRISASESSGMSSLNSQDVLQGGEARKTSLHEVITGKSETTETAETLDKEKAPEQNTTEELLEKVLATNEELEIEQAYESHNSLPSSNHLSLVEEGLSERQSSAPVSVKASNDSMNKSRDQTTASNISGLAISIPILDLPDEDNSPQPSNEALELHSIKKSATDLSASQSILAATQPSLEYRRRTVNFNSMLTTNMREKTPSFALKKTEESVSSDEQLAEDPIFGYLQIIGKKKAESEQLSSQQQQERQGARPSILLKGRSSPTKVLQGTNIETFVIEKNKPKRSTRPQ